MADFNEKFRVLMLQGAKGDAYDDTQLRQDINEMLANVPYIKYTEDNGFELPIYTINDNSITAYSCWSSQKVNSEFTDVKDDITTINDNITSLNSDMGDVKDDIIDLKANDQSLTNGITLTRTDLHDLENNKVNPLWNMRWKDGGNVTDTDGIFVPWSNGSASTILILTMNNSDNRCCQVFLARKTMTSGQRAIRLCGASDTMGVYASISQSDGVLIALADDVTPYPTGAQIYYQYIEL